MVVMINEIMPKVLAYNCSAVISTLRKLLWNK